MVAAVYFCTFTQHPVRKQSLQFLRLLPASPGKSTSMRTTSCSPALITVNGIPFGNVIRTGGSIRKFFRVCISGCIVRSIRLDSILQNSSARSKSCGVSIPIVSTSLIPTFILYPFSSQRSCSKDSANSKEDCGSIVISFSTSVR